MNGMLRDLLSARADAAGTPHLDLDLLIAEGERRVSRRRRAALGGAVAAVALTVGTTFVLTQADDRATSPAGPPSSPPSTVDAVPDTTHGSRPLTYGVDGTIHYGDRLIEAAEDADGLFVFDDGLAILTGDDGNNADNRLYLTDGSEQVEIARRVRHVTPAEVGSLLVWLDRDDVVIYDTHDRGVVARVPLNGLRLANPITPLEEAVYWTEYDDATATKLSDGKLVRYDVSTGTRTRASQADYRAETRTAVSPILVVGSAESKDAAEDFTVIDSRLELSTDTQSAPPPVFVAATGERLRVSVPDGYDGETLSLFQWLDDDRFALVASVPGVGRAPTGDLLVCRIAAGQCHTIANGEQYWLLPGTGASVGGAD